MYCIFETTATTALVWYSILSIECIKVYCAHMLLFLSYTEPAEKIEYMNLTAHLYNSQL